MASANAEPAEPSAGAPSKGAARRWPSVVLTVGVVALAAFLVHRLFARFTLAEVLASVGAIPGYRLALAIAFAAASYLCLTGFDYLAVRYAGHKLAYRRVALASFSALSLGHNIGFAALSSGAIRYRFYARWGLSVGEVAKVILFCGVTVGLGLTILGGASLLIAPDLARQIAGLGRPVATGLGVACLAVAGLYVLLAATARGTLRLGRWWLRMPSLRLALGQIAIGPLNFACVAACLHQGVAAVAEIGYPGVAAAYVIANVTALISHVPGGLGVIESVMLFLLPQAEVIGALVLFRLVYFILPLAIGGLVFAAAEMTLGAEGSAGDAR